jgi:hypothetical protein
MLNSKSRSWSKVMPKRRERHRMYPAGRPETSSPVVVPAVSRIRPGMNSAANGSRSPSSLSAS